ncbi:FAD-dependent oxidoreductase [Tahibacter soli]|uniref:FAD-dependent oxidoreductase n=1 Tax=Tahibacter soli TaxID=2983605 RepID=A0A9X3YSE1_9GAMM|nr:FAD-dependent oxidoreductase [Tahibacter soli]MDC8016118.1 FAD-dependent oxidoreductase [Tahibacter soli]
MTAKTYSIFGAGAAGLYTAWRLLDGEAKNAAGRRKLLGKGDTLELYDWGQYDFSKRHPGTRAAGARVCTWHYENDPKNSYLELGGMRYSEWDGTPEGQGHRLVTTVIGKLGLDKDSVPFNESTNPLFFLRAKNLFLNDISSSNPAPYDVDHYGAAAQPDNGFAVVENLAVTSTSGPQTRRQWCQFFQDGRIAADTGDTSVFQKGDRLSDIGYWNLMFDQLGGEGFNYTADGNGYTSNVINWNAAVAMNANNEFTPGNEYRTLTHGYSSMFNALFDAIEKLAKTKGVRLVYQPNTRLHSILQIEGKVHYTLATRAQPNKASDRRTTDAAWMAMPPAALDLVAQATRYVEHAGLDVLNHEKVQLFLESAVLQPSYKVGMFFDEPWWLTQATYAPQITGYEITDDVLKTLAKDKFPPAWIKRIKDSKKVMEQPFASAPSFVQAVEQCVEERLSVVRERQLLKAAERNTIGPSVTDLPIRQVVYFGHNAPDPKAKKVYGILASYDDETFTSFWHELEIGVDGERRVPDSANLQTLVGPRKAPQVMVKMLRKQLAAVHFGPQSDYTAVPEPLETAYMDWSLPPFNAGYHAWAAHYNVCEVQQKIRKPSQLIDGADANIFIVGEAFSNDQAWVEGAYCTAESVLDDFFDMKPIIDDKDYPFICPC